MKVLMSAYACEPNRGSEPGVGWNWALQAARFHEVWVLTRANNREVIELELARNPQPNLHFIYHDLPKWAMWWKKGGRRVRLYAFLWDIFALLPARRAHTQYQFDLVHRLTMNSIETPGILWMLGRPYLWGPVGGVQVPPVVLKSYFGNNWKHQRIRTIRRRLLRFNPFVRLSVKRAELILAANADTERKLRELGATRIRRLLEAGVPAPVKLKVRSQNVADPLRVLWIGGLIPLKAPRLAVDAIVEAGKMGLSCLLTMVGDGPLKAEIERYTADTSALDAVKLVGHIPHAEIESLFDQADVFLFTSLRDTSGNVVLESMSSGVPVIALNHHGVAEMLADDVGMLVSVISSDQVVRDLAGALVKVHRNPQIARQLGQAGRERILAEYSWDRKGEIIRDMYNEIVLSKHHLQADP